MRRTKLKKRTISTDLITRLSLIIMVVVVTFAILSYWYNYTRIRSELDKNSKMISDNLADIIALPLWNFDYDTITRITEAYINSGNLHGILIISKDGKIVLENNYVNDKDHIIQTRKVYFNTFYLGTIKTVTEINIIRSVDKRFLFFFALTILSIITIIIIGTILILRKLLTRPLHLLQVGIRSIADGDYSYKLNPVAQADINGIIDEVNKMANQIKDRTNNLFVEIEERTKAEKALQHRASMEQLLTEISTDFINLDVQNTDEGINHALCRLGEFTQAERTYVFLLNEDDTFSNTHEWCAEDVSRNIIKFQELNTSHYDIFFKNLQKNGVLYIPVLENDDRPLFFNNISVGADQTIFCVPMISKNKLIGFLGANTTTYVKKWADEDGLLVKLMGEIFVNALNKQVSVKEMAEIRFFLKSIIDSMPSILVSINSSSIITQWNHAAENFFKVPEKNAIGKNIWQNFPQFSKYSDYFQEVIFSGTTKEIQDEILVNKKKKIINIRLFPFIANNDKGMVIHFDDITDMEIKEQQLRQAQKMEIVGTLAGGIAHDFNNILGGIVGTLSIINYKIQKKALIEIQELKDYFKTIEESSNRAADIVQQLLTLSRKRDLSMTVLDLNMAMKHVKAICKNSFDKRIELRFAFTKSPALVQADLTQIEQSLLNLCVNASHAMTLMRENDADYGGVLSVGIDQIYADEHFRVHHTEAENIAYWVLSVRDTGVGMTRETIAKIFEPFFTTKDKEQGTGLGMAMVYNIVKQHSGFVNVYSEVGIGSTFDIYLPVYVSDKDVMKEEAIVDVEKGSGTILIIDDEDVMRRVGKTILTECGYDVLLAKDGNEGVEVFKKNYDEISLVLLDMVMPKKSGKEVYTEIKKIKPDIKVILASGFRQDERVEAALKMGIQSFIQKPFTLRKLASMVSELLNE